MCLLPFLPLSPVTAFLGGLCFLAASCPSLCRVIIVLRGFLLRLLCRRRFLPLPSLCLVCLVRFSFAAFFLCRRPPIYWFLPREWLESRLCLGSQFFFLVFLGAVFSCSLFVRRFFALRLCVCPCTWCFRLSGLKHVCLPFSPRVSPTERLDSCLLCLRNPCFFLLGAASSRSACAAVLRPASFCLLACFVFLLERSQCCLLALPLVYFCQGVA